MQNYARSYWWSCAPTGTHVDLRLVPPVRFLKPSQIGVPQQLCLLRPQTPGGMDGFLGFRLRLTIQQGPQGVPISWSHLPDLANLTYASSISQNDVCNFLADMELYQVHGLEPEGIILASQAAQVDVVSQLSLALSNDTLAM